MPQRHPWSSDVEEQHSTSADSTQRGKLLALFSVFIYYFPAYPTTPPYSHRGLSTQLLLLATYCPLSPLVGQTDTYRPKLPMMLSLLSNRQGFPPPKSQTHGG
ncbi:hypothetical protein ElyMa_004062300 [Elysia marginata]|uniref:CTNNB1 binding N-teminal domain-containing protein n=1 Tax=Elysia marginata TaxID=1093978 RepID=A0AAV4G821_9GAST|nr:hypothetical protein ElyMa_004062300 [Elysia marginata]